MAYCSSCGEKLSEGAVFCPKCGAKAGGHASASPADELRETFTRMSQEMEKAFTIAAKEFQEAFQVARSNIQKTIYKEPVVCPNCGEKNAAGAVYCFKCGKSLSGAKPAEPSKPAEGT